MELKEGIPPGERDGSSGTTGWDQETVLGMENGISSLETVTYRGTEDTDAWMWEA